jgi:hypothetical protein
MEKNGVQVTEFENDKCGKCYFKQNPGEKLY